MDRFSYKNITQVIGLEYHDDLAAKAQEIFGIDCFAFYQCDVESPDFSQRLMRLMAQNNVQAFDIIHISFVLLHLKNPGALLQILRGFLAPEGQLIVVEANDAVSELSPDTSHLFQDFLNILYIDPFSGDRDCGGKLPTLLTECGYQQITLENTLIHADGHEIQKKRDIFDTFCAYLPQDLFLLQKQEPDNAQYAACTSWLKRCYGSLRSLILAKSTGISIGVMIVTCFGE